MFAAFLLGNMYSAWFFLVIPICVLTTHHPYLDKKELMQMTIEWLHGEAGRKEEEAYEQYLGQEQNLSDAQEMSPKAKERLIKKVMSSTYRERSDLGALCISSHHTTKDLC
jgi:hypothetical protein